MTALHAGDAEADSFRIHRPSGRERALVGSGARERRGALQSHFGTDSARHHPAGQSGHSPRPANDV